MASVIATSLLGGVTSGFAFSLLSSIISFAISSIFQSLFAPDEPDAPEVEGPLLNKRSNTSPIPVVYGTRRIGGNRIFVATEGDRNKFLHLILLVCEGEVDGFEKLFIDDVELRFPASAYTNGVLTPGVSHVPEGAIENDERGDPMDTEKFSGLSRFRFHHGADDQLVDSVLEGAFSNWTSDHRLRGRAYIYARFEYDQDTFGGMPNITSDLRGKKIAKILDINTINNAADGTFPTDPAEIAELVRGDTISDLVPEYSDNPALCMRDYLINDDYGRGLDPATLDDAKIIEAAYYCDESITLEFGEPAADGTTSSTGPRYTCNGIVQTDSSLYDNTQKLLTHMRGFLVFSSGQYKLILDKAENSLDYIYDESNIIGSLSVNLGTKKNTLNRMRATFWNPTKNGEDDTIILEPTAIDPEDGERKTIKDILDNGVTLSREIQLPYCNNPHSARYLVNQEIEQSRQQIHITFTLGLAGLRNEIGDIIRVQHAQLGWGYRLTTIDGEAVLVKNSQITIANIGQSNLFNIWNAGRTYSTDGGLDDSADIVTFNGLLFKAIATSNGEAPGTGSSWSQITAFSQIPLLSTYGLLDLDDRNMNDSNIGIDGNFIYKEFRILSLSMKEQEEVEITAIEYDATVYDRYPLSAEDATPNTSFTNPNSIGPPTNLVTSEDLYITTNSGGVKASLTFTWSSPNNPFVQAYDVEIHVPEQLYSAGANYLEGAKVQFNGNRYQATSFNGPNGTLADPNNSAFWTILTELEDSDFIYLTRTRTRAATALDATPGTYGVRVRAVSVTGVRSEPLIDDAISVLGLIAPPADITGFGITPQADLALLQWTASTDLDVRIGGNIEVKHSPSTGVLPTGTELQDLWAASETLTAGKSGVTTQILVPLLTGTYLIKAVDSSGIRSLLPGAIVNTIESTTEFEFIDNYDEQAAWLGESTPAGGAGPTTGIEIFGDTIRLTTDLQVGETIQLANDVPNVTSGTYYFGQLVSFSEEKETRLTASVTATVQDVTAFWDVFELVDDIVSIDGTIPASSISVEISTTSDNSDPDNTVWSNYVQFSSGTFTFQSARFRLTITTQDFDTQIVVSRLTIGANAAAITQGKSNITWDGNAAATTTRTYTIDPDATPPTTETRTLQFVATGGVGDSGNYTDVYYSDTTDLLLPFFNDDSLNSGTGRYAEPFLGIAADGLVPGQYFVITNTDNGTTKIAGGAPFYFEGFRIQFKTVGVTDISGVDVLNAPTTGDATIGEDITFDYRATGF